jgi:predicted transport protein
MKTLYERSREASKRLDDLVEERSSYLKRFKAYLDRFDSVFIEQRKTEQEFPLNLNGNEYWRR